MLSHTDDEKMHKIACDACETSISNASQVTSPREKAMNMNHFTTDIARGQ